MTLLPQYPVDFFSHILSHSLLLLADLHVSFPYPCSVNFPLSLSPDGFLRALLPHIHLLCVPAFQLFSSEMLSHFSSVFIASPQIMCLNNRSSFPYCGVSIQQLPNKIWSKVQFSPVIGSVCKLHKFWLV